MNKALSLMSIFFVFALSANSYNKPAQNEEKIVKDIIIQGLHNLDEEDLRDKLQTAEGYPLRASEVRKDQKAIIKTGKIDRVKVFREPYRNGVRVKYTCTERPLIKSISFKGNDEISETDLRTTVIVKENSIARKDLLEKSVKLIKKKYDDEGLFNAVIQYKLIKSRGDDKSVKVVFIIDEGEEIKVKKISILGAKKIRPDELSWIMETSEDGLFKSGDFKQDQYEQDKQKIIAYYKQNGYLDAEIVEDHVEYEWVNPLKKEKRGIFITIKIKEGERYYFNGYSVKINTPDGDTVFFPEEFLANFEQYKKGSVFNNTLFQKDRQMISFKYATKGYIFARVIPRRTITTVPVKSGDVTRIRKFVKVDFIIDEGSQAYIDMIIIKGNSKTKDKVIRRELLFKEGELFNSSKLQLSREKVYNLGFFKQVNIDVRPGRREGYMNLIVDVEEQPTGTISLGGGYGTTSGFSIFADVAENNLLGNGQRVAVRFEYGPQRNSLTLSFNERWLFNKPIGLNTSIFYNLYHIQSNSTIFPTTDDEAWYDKESFGYSVGLSYRFLHYMTAGITWSHAFTRLKNISGNSSSEIFLTSKLGFQEKRSLIFYVSRDSRDNYMNPTKGMRLSLGANFTGGLMLGGEDHFIKVSPEAAFYFSPFHLPFLKTHPCVFELRASGTFIVPPIGKAKIHQKYWQNPWLEVEDRMNIGGPETLRGWDYYDDSLPQSWKDVGLFHRILYGAEFRVPIHPRMLWLVLFFDAGSLWSDTFWERRISSADMNIVAVDLVTHDLAHLNDFGKVNLLSYFKYSYGFGFRIQIPMMPLRFWFGQKLIFKKRFKPVGSITFQFAIGDMRF